MGLQLYLSDMVKPYVKTCNLKVNLKTSNLSQLYIKQMPINDHEKDIFNDFVSYSEGKKHNAASVQCKDLSTNSMIFRLLFISKFII